MHEQLLKRRAAVRGLIRIASKAVALAAASFAVTACAYNDSAYRTYHSVGYASGVGSRAQLITSSSPPDVVYRTHGARPHVAPRSGYVVVPGPYHVVVPGARYVSPHRGHHWRGKHVAPRHWHRGTHMGPYPNGRHGIKPYHPHARPGMKAPHPHARRHVRPGHHVHPGYSSRPGAISRGYASPARGRRR